MTFLNYDSPFIQNLRKAVDFSLLGLLWMLASIPIFTFGAATTAMHYTAENCIHQENGTLWATFWRSFFKEFWQATLLWLLSLVVTLPLALNVLLLWRVELNAIVFAILLATVILGVSWLMLWYGYLSKIKDSIGVLLINTFRIMLVNIPKLLLQAVIVIACLALALFSLYRWFPVLLLVPGIYAGLTGMLLRSIFRKYLPDTQTPESDDSTD